FMHNTHTPAPYGYGWTGLSMIPFGLGFGMFFTTWFAFKLFMISALYALYKGLQKLAVAMRGRELSVGQISLLFLNPLFLIETISSAHNDVWMMALAVWSLAFVMDHKKGAWHIIFSGLLLTASISIKYVTILIVPIWLFLVIRTFLKSKLQNIIKKKLRIQSQIIESVFQKSRDWANLFIPPILSWILFIPLLTARSQQFHPWYLIWVITWLPFISTTWWKWSLVALSISSLLRYLPWIANGAYSAQILASQKNITWIPFFIMVVLQILWWHSHKDKA
ncbi:MAG: hypothetical protein WAU07_03890, partial [Microgenomates group bacterium]